MKKVVCATTGGAAVEERRHSVSWTAERVNAAAICGVSPAATAMYVAVPQTARISLMLIAPNAMGTSRDINWSEA